MGLLGNVISAGIGYAISEASDSHPVREFCDRNFSTKSLEELISDYAKHRDIFRDNRFAKRLHDIASQYEEYDYEEFCEWGEGRRY